MDGPNARQALELLLEDSGARSGCLFLCGQTALFAAAAVDEIDSEESLLSIARDYLEGELGETMTETISAAGVALIAVTERTPRTPRVDLVRAVSHALRIAADGIGRDSEPGE